MIKSKTLSGDIRVSNSMLSTFLFCKRKFLLSYFYGLRPKTTSVPFLFGTYFHEGLDDFYKYKKIDTKKIIDKYFDEVQSFSCDISTDLYDKYNNQAFILEGLLEAYQRIYESDFDKMDYIDHEIEFSFPLFTTTNDNTYHYSGKIDLIFQDKNTKEFILCENKTAATIDSGYITKLALDPQVSGYILGGREIGYDCQRIIYNINGKARLRKKIKETDNDFRNRIIDDYFNAPDKYFVREDLVRGSAELKAFLNEIGQKTLDLDMFIKIGNNIESERDFKYFYKSEINCKSPWGMCEFFNVCSSKGGFCQNTIHENFRIEEKINPELSEEKK